MRSVSSPIGSAVISARDRTFCLSRPATACSRIHSRAESLRSRISATWRERLQSEVEAGAALSAVVDRADLGETGIRVSLKLPIPETSQCMANAIELSIARFFPMTIRRRGVEMRLVVEGNRAPARRADAPLLKAVSRAHQWSEDLVAGRAQSVAEIAERERIGPPLRYTIAAAGIPGPGNCRGDCSR
jgi:hypothetical protein